jgi:hypothetical protein
MMDAWHRTYEEFLASDPRRRGDAIELGHSWFDRAARSRACWYEGTGELTVEGLDNEAEPDIDDFHAGVSGPVRVIAVIRSRRELEALLARWSGLERAWPRSVARVRELMHS